MAGKKTIGKKNTNEDYEAVNKNSEEFKGDNEVFSDDQTEPIETLQVIHPPQLTEEEKEKLSFVPDDWTIMIYLSGDNNLGSDMTKAILALENMRESWNNSTNLQYQHIKVLAYLDTGVSTIPPIYYDVTKGSEGKKIASYDTETIKTFVKSNKDKPQGSLESSSSEDSLVNFVNWCVNEQDHKTENYALFLSGHSNAFDGSNLLRDEDSLDGLTLKSLKSTLSRVKEIINSHKTETKPLDILGFESCIMSLLEISYEFRDSVRYMISSQGETPSEGWGLEWVISHFLTTKTLDGKPVQYSPEEISKDIIKSYIKQQHELGLSGRSVDLSALDLSKTENLSNKLKILFEKIRDILDLSYLLPMESCSEDPYQSLPDYKEVIRQQIYKSIQTTHFNAQTFWFEQAVDIQDFVDELIYDLNLMKNLFERLTDAPSEEVHPFRTAHEEITHIVNELKVASKEVLKAIDDCVIENGSCGAEFQFANGISLFFPWSIQSYRQMMKSYLELDFAIGKGAFWVDFLEFYLHMTLKWRKIHKNHKVPDYLKDYVSVRFSETLIEEEAFSETLVKDTTRGTKQDIVRGTKQDIVRGTKQDIVRGTKQDIVRGSGFANSFKTLKNFDPDYWNFIRIKSELSESELSEAD